MARKKDQVGPLIEELAVKIATEALADSVTCETDDGKTFERRTTFEDRLDALAKLTAYQTGIIRAKAKSKDSGEEDEPESGTILDFQKRLKEASGEQ
jgi:Tfp pilus assembly protein PilN